MVGRSHQSGLFDAANEMLQYQVNNRPALQLSIARQEFVHSSIEKD